jgi:hypothetical protein
MRQHSRAPSRCYGGPGGVGGRAPPQVHEPGGGVRDSPSPLLVCTKAGPSRRVAMIDFGAAKILSHRQNIQRCVMLLATELTELERRYLHKRIAEERAELERLQGTQRELAGAVIAAEFPHSPRVPE